jgi:hypothetical protein
VVVENAATVLLEFLSDSFDPTPVMGNTQTGDPSSTKYYPGIPGNEPTALATNYVAYLALPPTSGCGITQANVWVLKDLADLTANEVGAIGGLVVNSWQGFSFGAGAYLNFSVGDNQILSDLLKTAASEVALRITLATAYASLRHIKFNPPTPPNPDSASSVGRPGKRGDRWHGPYPM